MLRDVPEADSGYVQDAGELRSLVARALHERASAIVKDSLAVYPFAGMENVAGGDRARVADLLIQLLATSVRDGMLDLSGESMADVERLIADKGLTIALLFSMVYLTERAALDELATNDLVGMSSETWPAITQLVRRASFDVCSSCVEHLSDQTRDGNVVDALTTVHTRTVFLAALEKEIQRSERFAHPFALIVLAVDRLSDINATYGDRAGDRVIERIGIVVRNYFRDTDWVARSSGREFAVLLPETQSGNAERLAERIRTAVEERLQLHDYRAEQPFPVTVSVGVLSAECVDPLAKAEDLLARAADAVERAQQAGGNRVERADAVG
jgi:diguanylate cyclase (GGDEF)-like protein